MGGGHSVSGSLQKFLHEHWLPRYDWSGVRFDLLAGVTLAAYAIPVSMAYASLAGLPPQHGIYCYLLGGVFYALLGTSKQLAIGPTSAIAMLVGVTVAEMADRDISRWAAITSLAALATGLMCLLAWSLKLSGLVSFISETVLVGFKAGAALTIGMTQLPKLLGVPGGGESFFERAGILLSQVPQTNLVVLGFGLVAIICLLAGDKYLPGRPVALFVVGLATLLVSLTNLEDLGIATVGSIPQGLPGIQLPSLRLKDVDGILPLGCACFLLSYIESISASRALGIKNDYEVNPRQELLALGAANLAVAFGQGFPVAGGLSQSAVNDKAGARTQLALLVSSVTLAVCLLFLTDLLENFPTVILASIVLVAIRGLVDLSALKRLRRVSQSEFKIALVAILGVILLGILKGVLLATIASLLMLLAGAARPHVAFLGRIPRTQKYSDLERHPDNEEAPDALIFRVESSLLYFNCDHVRQRVLARLKIRPGSRVVICDLSGAPMVDVAGASMLMGLEKELSKRGIDFRIVDAHARVRDLLRAVGLESRIGHLGRRLTIQQVLDEFHQRSMNPQAAGP